MFSNDSIMTKNTFWFKNILFVIGFVIIIPEVLSYYAWCFNLEKLTIAADFANNLFANHSYKNMLIRWVIFIVICIIVRVASETIGYFIITAVVFLILGNFGAWIHSKWDSLWYIYGICYVICAATAIFAFGVIAIAMSEKEVVLKPTLSEEELAMINNYKTHASETLEFKTISFTKDNTNHSNTHNANYSNANDNSDDDMFDIDNKSPYELLGLNYDASSDELIKAYNKLSAKYSKNEKIKKALDEAYLVLKTTGVIR